MYRVTLEARGFDFEAYGKTEEEALSALREGCKVHCAECYTTFEDFEEDFLEDPGNVGVHLVYAGICYRDNDSIWKSAIHQT
jgi:hypothetical protein